MRKLLAVLICIALLAPASAFASDDLQKKIDALSKELDKLKQQMQEIQKKDAAKEERITRAEEKAEKAAGPSWLEIGGDYRARLDSLKGTIPTYWQMDLTTGMPFQVQKHDVKNDILLTNRLGLNLRARATEDIQVKARLLMYKVWGHQTSDAVTTSDDGAFFADKSNVFDGNTSHIPQDSIVRVDQAYATWSNIFDLPVWFSVGRRPSTGGVPTNIRQNTEKGGTAGVPGFLIDYAFDGLTVGVAPDIDALPGAYAKVCYGRGFDSGFRPNKGLKDVDFLGINVVPYDTDNFHAEVQWDRAFDIFAFPEEKISSTFGPNTNLGDIDQFGLLLMGKLDDIGPGDLNLFGSAALSKTHPNNNTLAGMAGLLYDAPPLGEKKSRTGTAYYVGARYDIIPTGTKIGVEYNYGSKYWIAFAPASDDMWTAKLGTHGSVYEVYAIQELMKKPISKRGNAFFRLGYQYYDFKYTGSNNWVGEPKKISDLDDNPANAQMLPPLDKAHNIYLTFDVTF